MKKNLIFYLALYIAKIAVTIIRMIYPNRGSNFPGQVALRMGIPREDIKRGLCSFEDIKERVAEHEIEGLTIHYMKIKQENSETLQSSLDYIAEQPGKKNLFIGFDEYLDFYPGYSFIFNLFDCDFSKMNSSDISRWTCTSKALANAAAVKFSYDGFPEDKFRATGISTYNLMSRLVSFDKSAGLDANVYMVEEVPFWKKH